ncbi:hypothetical protein SISNIDRAFT_462900 [Sistotremastrum niveocremeum HHB9708]|uniref:Uncharacterized protein n=1 Tax=Sistotremastrum niveocremeum HHB9708 TaxID=1314777 RepID=A0A164ZRM1_9AGAM|nr:hypothetical protein SISNIDRAFT_462900 [Sistotremastrum niveocremeum HHB9708]
MFQTMKENRNLESKGVPGLLKFCSEKVNFPLSSLSPDSSSVDYARSGTVGNRLLVNQSLPLTLIFTMGWKIHRAAFQEHRIQIAMQHSFWTNRPDTNFRVIKKPPIKVATTALNCSSALMTMRQHPVVITEKSRESTSSARPLAVLLQGICTSAIRVGTEHRPRLGTNDPQNITSSKSDAS